MPAEPPLRGRSLRLTRPEAASAAVNSRTARTARVLHGGLIFAIAANTMAIGVPHMGVVRGLSAALVSGMVYLGAFRGTRRDATFARLSAFAQGIYRIRASLTGAFALGAISYFVPWLHIDPERIAIATGVLVIVATLWGQLTRRLLDGDHVNRTLLIGDGEQVGRFVAEFHADPHPGYAIVGLVTETGAGMPNADVDEDTTLREVVAMLDETSGAAGGVPVLGNLDDLETVLAAEGIDTVVVAARRNRLQLFARLADYAGSTATRSGFTVQELPAFSEQVFGRVPIDVINAAWFMHMIHPFYRPYSRVVKRAGDLAASTLITLVALPLLPLTALLVRLTSPGPILYSQVRVGERGREFRIYKFRTMRQDAEAAGAQWAQQNDPRVTPAGRLMRTTRLDELPQLWNILAGHMSFVGPRPERPEFVTQLEQDLPYYQRRHLVKPGLTGWAQVRQGYTDSVDSAQHKLGYELYYLKHQSLFLDFVIFVETIRVVLMRFGSR
jgi:exopolysaccharide biosynthesis polyprenyl glycosylphosphotransferase